MKTTLLSLSAIGLILINVYFVTILIPELKNKQQHHDMVSLSNKSSTYESPKQTSPSPEIPPQQSKANQSGDTIGSETHSPSAIEKPVTQDPQPSTDSVQPPKEGYDGPPMDEDFGDNPATANKNLDSPELLSDNSVIEMTADEDKTISLGSYHNGSNGTVHYLAKLNVEKYTTFSGYHTSQGDVNAEFSMYMPANDSPDVQVKVDPNDEFSLMPLDASEPTVNIRTAKLAHPGKYQLTIGIYVRVRSDSLADKIRGDQGNFQIVREFKYELNIR